MRPHKLTSLFLFLLLTSNAFVIGQRQKAPAGGRLAIVVDERLAAVRETPQLTGKLVRRLGRGRLVAVRATKSGPDGITFLLVNLSSRTHGWIQREAVVSPSRTGDDEKMFELIKSSTEFDLVARARSFLDNFPRSRYRAEVLLLMGDAAEEVSAKLSREAARRITERPTSGPEFAYYLNHNGLDRYNRQGVGFVFEKSTKRLHYDGKVWRELVRRYPGTLEAAEAKERLKRLNLTE